MSEKQKLKLAHGNVKCNCGHTKKDHFRGGACHSSGHPKRALAVVLGTTLMICGF